MDISHWVDDMEKEDEEFNFGGSDFRWLQEAIAITSKAIVYGYCDDYGQLEGTDLEGNHCDVCVLKGNWQVPKPKNKKRKKSSMGDDWADSDEEEVVNGILAHRVCWEMLARLIDDNVTVNAVFRRLSSLLPDYSQCLNGIQYDNIHKNHGQDYELHSSEGHLVSDPRPLCGVRTHTNPLERIDGVFSKIPMDCLTSILTYCDVDMLLALGCASKSACAGTRHVDVYTSYVSADLTYEDSGELLVFEHPAEKANYIRISRIINQVAMKLKPLKSQSKMKKKV